MNKPKVQLSMAIRNKIAKPFPMGSSEEHSNSKISQVQKSDKSEQAIFSMLSIYIKTLSLPLVAEALTGLNYHPLPVFSSVLVLDWRRARQR